MRSNTENVLAVAHRGEWWRLVTCSNGARDIKVGKQDLTCRKIMTAIGRLFSQWAIAEIAQGTRTVV